MTFHPTYDSNPVGPPQPIEPRLTIRRFDPKKVQRPRNLPQLNFQQLDLWIQRNQSRPVNLEIGCGVGWHSIRYAQGHPDENYLAFEQTHQKFSRLQSRLDRHDKLENLVAIHGDAVSWLTHYFAMLRFDRCFILYPNPEPKAPNRRWFRSPFMRHLLHLIKPGGEIILATNEKWYWQEALEFAEQHWRLTLKEKRCFSSRSQLVEIPRTHFEKKYLLRGETCFDLKFIKPLR